MFIQASAATFSGGNLPFDSSFHLGVVSGLGTGVSIGGEVFYPTEVFSLGGEVEQQITNFQLEQNLSILRYGLVLKYVFSKDLFFTFHMGTGSFFITNVLHYTDSYGRKQLIDEDTHANASYVAFAPNFMIWDYFLTPKFVVNNIRDGGTVVEWDFNVGKKF